MKRIISTLLALVLILSLAGCSGGETAGSTVAETSTGTTTASTNEGQKLIIWAWDQNLPTIDYAIEQYKKMNPDSKLAIEIQNVPETVDKISTFFASNATTDLPDMVLMDNLQIQIFLQQFSDKFVNLSDRGFDEFKSNFSESQWDLLSKDGKIYAFPFDIAPIMVESNTEVLSAAGIDPASLKTWEAVINATPAVNKAGFAMFSKFEPREVFGMLQSSGVGIFDNERNIDLLNPKVVEVIDLYKKLVAANVSDEKASGTDFSEGKVAMQVKPAWMIGEDMPSQPALDGKVMLIPLPMVSNSAGYNSSANDGGSSFFILNSSPVADAAYEIGKIIATDMESQNIALKQGLMPGYLPAADSPELKKEVAYYQNQPIWMMLSKSAVDTTPVFVNEFYPTAKDIFVNTVFDQINSGTDKSAKDLLQEAADLIAAQTGLTIKTY